MFLWSNSYKCLIFYCTTNKNEIYEHISTRTEPRRRRKHIVFCRLCPTCGCCGCRFFRLVCAGELRYSQQNRTNSALWHKNECVCRLNAADAVAFLRPPPWLFGNGTIPMSVLHSETPNAKNITCSVVSQDGATISCGEPDDQRGACHSALRAPLDPSWMDCSTDSAGFRRDRVLRPCQFVRGLFR